ncbi:MAG TPA: VWA domain-containing protein [Alloacidobacterium sp.]|nr:VWA domain-containing protein [Alloacidobacterium sp.]
MKIRACSAFVCCLFSLCLACGAQAAQNPPTTPHKKELQHRTAEDIEKNHAAERRITLDVTVTDASGHPVTGLQQQDFQILDNHQLQTITAFHAVEGAMADPPDEVVIVIDLINTSYQRIGFERQQIEKFLQQNNGHTQYPVRLILVSETGIQAQPQASQDGQAIIAALDNAHTGMRAIGRAAGAAGAAERLDMSLRYFEQLIAYEGQIPGRKLMLWISPGWPMLDSPAFLSSNNQQRRIFRTVVGFTNQLRQAHVTLYTVDPLGAGEALGYTFLYQSFLKPLTKAKDANYGNMGLQVFAAHSGGSYCREATIWQRGSTAASPMLRLTMCFPSIPLLQKTPMSITRSL